MNPTPSDTLRFPARDGTVLTGSVFASESAPASAPVALFVGAMGVRRDYYAPFAHFLAGRGIGALTFDYRGLGDSRDEGTATRDDPATLTSWGALDLPGAIDAIRERFPRRRVVLVTHSIGGQLVGLADNATCVTAMLAVGSQALAWRYWSGIDRWLVRAVWSAVIPMAVRAFGYLPAKLGAGAPLPPGVAREWAAWGNDPAHLFASDPAHRRALYERLHFPIRAVSFADDRYAPREAVDALLACYPNCTSEHEHHEPAAYAAASIGHFGFFRETFRDTLWRESAAWLARV